MTKRKMRMSYEEQPEDVAETTTTAQLEDGATERAAPVMVAVTVIHEQGPTALVQWQVGRDWRRAYVPVSVVHSGQVARDELDAGIPYGVQWERYITITGTPEDVGYELRRRNIWTIRDMDGRYVEAQAAFLAAFGANIGAMLQAVRKLEA